MREVSLLSLPRARSLGRGYTLRLLSAWEALQCRREGEELAGDEKDAKESTPPETLAPDAPAEKGGGIGLLPILGCVGGVAALVAAGVWITKKMKERRT